MLIGITLSSECASRNTMADIAQARVYVENSSWGRLFLISKSLSLLGVSNEPWNI